MSETKDRATEKMGNRFLQCNTTQLVPEWLFDFQLGYQSFTHVFIGRKGEGSTVCQSLRSAWLVLILPTMGNE